MSWVRACMLIRPSDRHAKRGPREFRLTLLCQGTPRTALAEKRPLTPKEGFRRLGPSRAVIGAFFWIQMFRASSGGRLSDGKLYAPAASKAGTNSSGWKLVRLVGASPGRRHGGIGIEARAGRRPAGWLMFVLSVRAQPGLPAPGSEMVHDAFRLSCTGHQQCCSDVDTLVATYCSLLARSSSSSSVFSHFPSQTLLLGVCGCSLASLSGSRSGLPGCFLVRTALQDEFR